MPDADFDLPSICPICTAHHDATSNLTGPNRPGDGDITVCIVCAGVSIYDFSRPGKLRFPTDDELVEIDKDPEVARIRWALGVVRDRMGPPKGDYWPEG